MQQVMSEAQRAALRHCLETEGQRIFYSLPHTGDTFASAVAALKQHLWKHKLSQSKHKLHMRQLFSKWPACVTLLVNVSLMTEQKKRSAV